MPKMRWCFTRFGVSRLGTGWPKMRWYFTRFGVRALAARTRLGAYATRCFRFWSWTKTFLLRTYAACFCARVRDAVWVARGVMAFFALYTLKYILHRSQ